MKPKNLFTIITLITVIVFSMAVCDNGTNGGGNNGEPKNPGGDNNNPNQPGNNTPTVINVIVNPATATVTKGQIQQFNALVTGTNSPAQTVNWTVSGGVNGTNISPSGLLTVAANETAAALTVRATSTVDRNKSGMATVTVTAPVPPVSWSVNNLATWIEAVNGIRNGGNNKNHIVTVSGDFTLQAVSASDNTFGSVTGITVNIEGSHTITASSSSSGRLLQISDGQTVVVKNITLQGHSGNIYEMVRINDGGVFRMEGSASVTGNTATVYGGGVYIDGGTFIMQDNATVTGNDAVNNGLSNLSNSYGGGVYVRSGTFIMQGSAIVSNNTAIANYYAYGGGVYVGSGTFTLKENAMVKENTVSIQGVNSANGGGVCINGGTFIMEGGSISDNTASGGNYNANGGGVYVGNGTFNMRNGTISGNIARGNRTAGGGVYGNFTMENGVISGNTVSATGSNSIVEAQGGGVYVVAGTTFTMQGGTISGNTVSSNRTGGSDAVYAMGGGVYGNFTMEGGVITGNTVSAVYTGSSGNVKIFGGGVCVTSSLTKTGGTIYGNDAADNLRNTVAGGQGHAVYVYIYDNWRNATAGPSMNTDNYGFLMNEED